MAFEVLMHGLLTRMPLDLWASELSWLIPMVEKVLSPPHGFLAIRSWLL